MQPQRTKANLIEGNPNQSTANKSELKPYRISSSLALVAFESDKKNEKTGEQNQLLKHQPFVERRAFKCGSQCQVIEHLKSEALETANDMSSERERENAFVFVECGSN